MSDNARKHPLLLAIGGGNMTRAIVGGGIDQGMLDPSRIVVVDPAEDQRTVMGALGVHVEASAREGLRRLDALEAGSDDEPGSGQIMLAVKPQMLQTVADEIRGDLAGSSRMMISILAGTPGAKLRDALGSSLRVIRVMPNTPAQIGEGMAAISPVGVSDEDTAFTRSLFEAIGKTITIDEDMQDSFTGVAGSGPAYVFYLAEAMLRAGIEMGLTPEQSDLCVRQTIAGAALLLRASEDGPDVLRARVTSKGGTTAAAIGALDERGVRESVVAAMKAARDRGSEMAAQ